MQIGVSFLKKFFLIALFTTINYSFTFATTTASLVPGREVNTARDEQLLWSSNNTIGVPVLANNSYFCVGIGARNTDSIRFDPSIPGLDGFSALRGTSFGTSSNTNTAISFVSNVTSSHLLVIDSSTTGAGAGSARGRILCKNSTLFGNFNTVTAANPVNFLEINNHSTFNTNVMIVIRSFNGTELNKQTIEVAGNTRRDIGIHEIAGAGNTFGSVVLAHDGPLGAITGNVSKYKFDGVNLDITATEPLRLKDQ